MYSWTYAGWRGRLAPAAANNCVEPVNFAFIQRNGVPAGPPSPQLTDMSTFTPNAHTLMINPGDVLVVTISDPPAGFTTEVADLTTHKTGWMTASAANGFMNTNITDCTGTPFTFHAEYSTAKQQNQVPWAALEGGVADLDRGDGDAASGEHLHDAGAHRAQADHTHPLEPAHGASLSYRRVGSVRNPQP